MHSCEHAGHVRASRAWSELTTLQPPRHWRRSDHLEAVACSPTLQQREAGLSRRSIPWQDCVKEMCEGCEWC